MSENLNGDIPLYEKSKVNQSCVTIVSGKDIYHFDLKKIKEFKYLGGYIYLDETFEPMLMNKKITECLIAALTDWHAGRFNNE